MSDKILKKKTHYDSKEILILIMGSLTFWWDEYLEMNE